MDKCMAMETCNYSHDLQNIILIRKKIIIKVWLPPVWVWSFDSKKAFQNNRM